MPAADTCKVVCSAHQGEGVFGLALFQGIQCADRVVRLRHLKLYVVNPDLQLRMSADGLDCCVVSLLPRCAAYSIFERILR